MTAKILAGKEVCDAIFAALAPLVKQLDPKLTVIQVGNDPASDSYVRQKLKSCDAVGMRHEHVHLKDDVSKEELFSVIEKLNGDPDVSGFILQLPLPSRLTPHIPLFIRAIDPKKDADGFTAYNIGKTMISREFEHLPPATPSGIISLLEHYGFGNVEGKEVVIVNHSNVVGKPLAAMLLNRNATVTVCHAYTKDLAAHTRRADMLVSAVGKPKLITKNMVKPGAVVIDVGITRTAQGLAGDVDFDSVKEIAGAITPVPGGVGPLTVASLIRNTVKAKQRQVET
ncbi:bifunctional 5,10-methylene-tetrahydrofolate dehydrogenase/5,10-methylene-tetrahydrofolate cyclohydrolase [Candidatus Peregrinibacteria bacterium]|nr:bifunctional 5,10-methylene-tetrahydrofolate dehydrogenase/5,10-methylene-tetrahydrofolate cyclohydrolase [Candidatus Peregrinibacteria bacterium]